ncbi:MAG: LysR family transcriptional regulator [Streptosporangiales bacterium]
MLNPVHLVTLKRVLAHDSFVAAAAELGYTASAVSQQMRALERSTGLALFEREPRGIRPTAAAHYLADACTDMVLGLRSLEHDARAMAAAERGEIGIGSFRTASARILPGAFAAFRKKHPSVVVRLHEGEPEQLLPNLLNGSLDLALVYENDLDLQEWPNGLSRIALFTEERSLLLPPGRRPTKKSVRLADLSGETWIASDPSPSLFRFCASVGFEPNVTLRTNDYYSICAFVRAGLGIALVPELGRHFGTVLKPLGLTPHPPRRHVFVLHRSTNKNPLLAPFIEVLRSGTSSN